MQTLTPTTTIRWIKRLELSIKCCTKVIDTDAPIPTELWLAIRNARTEAIIVRDELLELVVAPVEVETV